MPPPLLHQAGQETLYQWDLVMFRYEYSGAKNYTSGTLPLIRFSSFLHQETGTLESKSTLLLWYSN